MKAPVQASSSRQWRAFLGPKVSRLLISAVFAGFALSAVEVAFSILIQLFLSSLGILGEGVSNLPAWLPKGFREAVIMLVIASFIRAATQWYKLFSHSMINESFSYHLKGKIAQWALLSRDSDSGTVVTMLADRVQNGAAFVTAVQNSFIHILSLTLILAYLLKLSAFLAFGGFAVLFAAMLLIRGLDRKVKSTGYALNDLSANINERLIDAVRNLLFLKIRRSERRELAAVSSDLNRYIENVRVFNIIKCVKFASPQFIGALVIILIGAYNREHALIAGGAFISFVYLFVRCSQTLSDLSSTIATMRVLWPQINDLYLWWEKGSKAAPLPALDGPGRSTGPLSPTSWELKQVHFDYGGRSILKNFDLKTEPGHVTVITGPSGVGKSTLLYLLSGLIEPAGGALFLNADRLSIVEAFKRGTVRFGYVGPEPHVISGTIRENLAYGLDHEVTEAEILDALKRAHCTEFLEQLPQDLDRHITERGEGLSAGQKQRLSLARALLSKPTALLLDEPTSNLDSVSTRSVIESLRMLRGEISMIIISHNDALLEIADKVVRL